MLLSKVLVSSLLLHFLYYEAQCYKIPAPQVEVFTPKGFRISIEDTQGISQVQFRVNLTKRKSHIKMGTYQKKVDHKRAGKWIFTRRNVRLEVGDIISYQLLVIKDKMGYKYISEPYIVTELIMFYTINGNQGKPSKNRSTTTAAPTTTTVTTTTTTTTEKSPPSKPRPTETMLELCKEVSMNAAQAVMLLQSQITKLEKENVKLITALNRYPDAKKLTLAGRIPPDDDPIGTVKFILWEKLDLKPKIIHAERNPDKSIVFELSSLSDKIEVLETAKERLKYSRILIF